MKRSGRPTARKAVTDYDPETGVSGKSFVDVPLERRKQRSFPELDAETKSALAAIVYARSGHSPSTAAHAKALGDKGRLIRSQQAQERGNMVLKLYECLRARGIKRNFDKLIAQEIGKSAGAVGKIRVRALKKKSGHWR